MNENIQWPTTILRKRSDKRKWKSTFWVHLVEVTKVYANKYLSALLLHSDDVGDHSGYFTSWMYLASLNLLISVAIEIQHWDWTFSFLAWWLLYLDWRQVYTMPCQGKGQTSYRMTMWNNLCKLATSQRVDTTWSLLDYFQVR